MKYVLLYVCLISTSLFAETISETNNYGSVSSGIATDNYGSNSSGTIVTDQRGSESGYNVYKKVFIAVQPDAIAVLEGGNVTPLFLRAKEILEEQHAMRFGSDLEAALMMIESQIN